MTWKSTLKYHGVILFILALVTRLGVCVWGYGLVPPTADGSFYHIVAQRIAQGEGYTWLWPDGVITYAAHYPVGYPALISVPYFLFGPDPLGAMLVNALFGAGGVLAAYGLAVHLLSSYLAENRAHTASFLAAAALALSPTLVLYTPALMTEGSVGAVVTLATWLSLRFRENWDQVSKKSRLSSGFFIVILLAGATLLRPQSIVMSSVLGWLIGSRTKSRTLFALAFSLATLLLVSPWTLRNCSKMQRCVLVSANGGWNLLIGTYPEGKGAWIGLEGERVPNECREVFSEAGKDECFARAARRRIHQHPLAWLRLIPLKLRATLEYSAAAADHLKEAGAITDTTKIRFQIVEYLWQRPFSMMALLGAAVVRSRKFRVSWRSLVFSIGIVGFAGCSASMGWWAMVVLVAADKDLRTSVPGGAALGVVLSTAAIHAVFFGAGRYSIPMWYAVTPLVALGVAAVTEVKFAALWASRRDL